MFLVVLEVILRDAFETTLGGTIEISEVLLVFLVFIGMSYTQHVGGHVATDLLTARVPIPVARVFRFVGLMVAVVVLLWAAQATAVRGWDSMQTGEIRFGIREVPIWPARLIIPVGFFLTALETLFAASDTLRRDWRPSTAGGGDESTLPPEVATP
jgi:TRAP-type C4-dicarboxylate transport system permease small subunit